MTSYSQNIKIKYGVKNYEEIRKTLEWIRLSSKKVFENPILKYDFTYRVGDINCKSNSFEDFVKNVYGTDKFYLSSFYVYVYENKKDVYSKITFSYLWDFDVSTNDKILLEKIVSALNICDVEKISLNDNVVINSDIAIVSNDNSTINISNSNIGENNINNSKKDSFLKRLIEHLTKNIIWYIISALLATGLGVGCFEFLQK